MRHKRSVSCWSIVWRIDKAVAVVDPTELNRASEIVARSTASLSPDTAGVTLIGWLLVVKS